MDRISLEIVWQDANGKPRGVRLCVGLKALWYLKLILLFALGA